MILREEELVQQADEFYLDDEAQEAVAFFYRDDEGHSLEDLYSFAYTYGIRDGQV